MYNNNLSSSSHKQLKTLLNQIKSIPVLKSIEQLKTEGIQYYFHQGYEKKVLHKMFTLYKKKRHIQRYINHQVYTADLNGISLKTSQIDRFNLYQKGLTYELNMNSNSNLNRLKKADFQTQSTEQLYGYKKLRAQRYTHNIRSEDLIHIIREQQYQLEQDLYVQAFNQTKKRRIVNISYEKRQLFSIFFKTNIFSNQNYLLIKLFMNFKFKTIRRTRNALNAQQIYWEIIKLKKYFRVKTIFGKERKAEIIIHRTQLPNNYKTHDMSLFIEQHQETQNMFYYIATGLFSFSIMHIYAKMLYDDDTRYWVSIRFPNHMKQFDIFNSHIQNQYDYILEKLQLKNKDLSGAVGYHNLKQGIKDLFKRETQIIDFETTDKSIEGLDSFLQEQDQKVLKSIK
ncbi:unnamed protein product [Paramecium pentaurelia]|uniref:Uncharacterized protein n=1 Tax=Paramecium pentaurelia TaxID=43138 RepID=A0A8S1TF45_9CILI|nr:unnamed protein product [Paramecium pentaurelia]